MDRREIIKSFAATVGASVAMPESAFARLSEAVAPSDLTYFTEAERLQVEVLAEAIIPETETPGAISAGVPDWIEVIVKDCYSAKEQKTIRDGLADTMRRCQKQHGRNFGDLSEKEQVDFLEKVDEETKKEARKAKRGPRSKTFLELFKDLTKYCFVCSEVGATQVFDYRPVPGAWIPSLPLTSEQKVWAL